MPAIPLITAAAAVGSVAVAAKGVSNANKAANAAANAKPPTVDIPGLQTQAQNIAQQNAANSAALEQQYNPGAAELRAGSLQSLLQSLNPNSSEAKALSEYIAKGAPAVGQGPNLADTSFTVAPRAPVGTAPVAPEIAARPETSAGYRDILNRVQTQAGQPLTETGFDSALTRQAVAAAAADLAQGGALPQDVRNLVARTALAKSGTVSGGLALGRDITARDLGLTSLDIYNKRLANAAALGSQEAGLEQANAAMRQQAEQFGRNNLLQSQQALADYEALLSSNYATDAQIAQAKANLDASNFFNTEQLKSSNYATDAQIAQAQANQVAQRNALESQNYWQGQNLGQSNYFNQANLLQNIQNGNFAQAFQAAQLGQNIAQPASGLDPGSVANIAIGNTNATAAQQQNASALAAGAANQQTALGGQMLGTTLGFAQNYFKPTTYSYTSPTTFGATNYTPPATNYSASLPAVYCWVAREVFGADNPEWMQFRDWLLTEGSPELVEFYGQNGPAIAEEIKDMPAVKTLIKHLMVAAKGGK